MTHDAAGPGFHSHLLPGRPSSARSARFGFSVVPAHYYADPIVPLLTGLSALLPILLHIVCHKIPPLGARRGALKIVD